jgi:hypothetical protein
MKRNKNIYIYTLIILAFCKSIIEILLNLKEMEVSQTTNTIWGGIFILLSILWVYYDADRPDFKKPFDFGFIVYVFWPIALPWYLITTRGLEGILIFFGFISLWLGPWLAGLVAYVYYT